VTWPAGTRAYAEGSTEEMQPVAGRLAGVKRFKFVVVPTQAGVLTVPAVNYPYYDFARRAYAVTSTGTPLKAATPLSASTARGSVRSLRLAPACALATIMRVPGRPWPHP